MEPLKLTLFITFFKSGCFSFGGGYGMIPIFHREIVENYGWMKDEEFVDMLAVTQSAPGPVAVNTSVFIGYKMAGLPGAVIALAGTILPSFLIMLLLAVLVTAQGETGFLNKFIKGLRPAVVGLILGAGLTMGEKCMRSLFDVLTGFVSLGFLLLLGVHPIALLIGGAGIGIILSCKKRQREGV